MSGRINADQGVANEYLCAHELIKRGFVPCWPSEGQHYDFICNHKASGNTLKIQVKSSRKTFHNNGKKVERDLVTVSLLRTYGETGKRKSSQYNKLDVDFFLVYLSSYDVWYVIPQALAPTALKLRPNSDKCKWRAYIDAWDLLK